MKQNLTALNLAVLISVLLSMVSCVDKNNELNIIPAPVEVYHAHGGDFILNESTVFVASGPEEIRVAEFYASRLSHSTGFDLKIVSEPNERNNIILKLDTESIVPEGYLFSSNNEEIVIKGGSRAGLFYGMATFMQLLPAEVESSKIVKNVSWAIPSLEIGDYPRFAYRGIHLDPCRHFMEIEDIKKTIDVLAQYKINNIHIHLTEDQGWRMEIKKYPQLTIKGSTRVEGEGFVHKGYYTQEELRDLVAYADMRCVNIVPEIEMPGHALSAISAYPELSCKGEPTTPRIIWGVEDVVMCAGKEFPFMFIEDVLKEVADIFPSPYIHIGGDECPKSSWEKCPLCQKRIDEEGLREGDDGHTPEERLQSYFIKRVEKIAAKLGKRIMGWDEILEGGLPESAMVMSWRGTSGGIAAASQGHEVIMTPSSEGVYFDHYQGDPGVEPVGIGGYAPMDHVYSYNPVPDTLVKLNMQDYIIGVQANNWSEYFYDSRHREYMLYPRAFALAEIAWTPVERKDYSDFCRRVDGDACARLDYKDVNYHIPIPEQKDYCCDRIAFVNDVTLAFKTTRPMRIVFTLDGSEPDANSERYHTPLRFVNSTVLKICSVLPTGKCSPVRTINVVEEKYRPAINVNGLEQGLSIKVAEGMFLTRSDLENGTDETSWRKIADGPSQSLRAYRYTNNSMRDFPYYAAVGEGYISIPEDGVYYFSSLFNDVSIDGEMIIDNDGQVKRNNPHNRSSIALAKGLHRIKITFLGNIIGGIPSGWDGGDIAIRNAEDNKFEVVAPEMFWH